MDGIDNPPTEGLLRSRTTSFRGTKANQQLVRPSPHGSSASSACTGHIQLSFCWSGSRKGGGLKACSTTGCGVTEGTLGTYPAQGYKKALAIPGAKSKCVGATDRACKSPTLFRDEIARRNTVFRVRWRSVISSIGSNGGLQRAFNTTAKSQGGIRDRTGGLSLNAPRRKRVTKGCLPTDCPPR